MAFGVVGPALHKLLVKALKPLVPQQDALHWQIANDGFLKEDLGRACAANGAHWM
jgi:hypothetical protein